MQAPPAPALYEPSRLPHIARSSNSELSTSGTASFERFVPGRPNLVVLPRATHIRGRARFLNVTNQAGFPHPKAPARVVLAIRSPWLLVVARNMGQLSGQVRLVP